MILFGGLSNAGYLNDVWVLSNANGLGGIPAWRQIYFTGSAPPPRATHTAVYDNTNNIMTIYSGTYDYYYSFLNDVWVLNNANSVTTVPGEIWQLLDK